MMVPKFVSPSQLSLLSYTILCTTNYLALPMSKNSTYLYLVMFLLCFPFQWQYHQIQSLSVFFKDFIYLLLEGGKERKRNIHVREKHHWLPFTRALTLNQTLNPGMCPDQESNWWPLCFEERCPTNSATAARARVTLVNSLSLTLYVQLFIKPYQFYLQNICL